MIKIIIEINVTYKHCHHKNGIFYFRYRSPHSCDYSFLVNNFLSKTPSSSCSIADSSLILPTYLFFYIQRSRNESNLGNTVPPSQLAWPTSIYLPKRSAALSALSSYSAVSNILFNLESSSSDNCGMRPPPPMIRMLVRNFFLASESLIDHIEAATISDKGW